MRLGLLVFVLGTCCCTTRATKPVVEEVVQQPILDFQGLKTTNQSYSGTDIIIKYGLTCEHTTRLTLQSCSYQMDIKGIQSLSDTIRYDLKLLPNKKQPVVTTIHVPWPEEPSQIVSFLAQKELSYHFVLACKVGGPSGAMSIEARDGGVILLPKLPRLDVIQANAQRLEGNLEARVNFELSMLNENPFPIKLNKIIYRVLLEDKDVAQDELLLVELIPASAEFSYDVTTPIFNAYDHKDIMEILKKSQIDYKLVGTLHVENLVLDLNTAGIIRFSK